MSSAEVRTTTLHLLRALLRTVSYLPDGFAQTYIHNYIIHRFRNANAVTPVHLKAARSGLNTLRRATNGELKPLTHVLLLAYGRIGRRRRELVKAFTRPESKSVELPELCEEQAVDELGDSSEKEVDDYYKTRPRLRKFLQSQLANSPLHNPRPPLLGLEPAIPAKNIWNRPVPLNRQENLRRKWWAQTLDGILPPLPEKEWNRLRDLATGVIKFTGPPTRRVRAGAEVPEDNSMLKVAYLKKPVRDAARKEKDMARSAMEAHRLTPRFMRRVWADVWALTPMILENTETEEWSVIWGGGRSAISRRLIASAGPADLELFEGSDALQTNSVRRPSTPRMPPRKNKPFWVRFEVEELVEVVERLHISTDKLNGLMGRLSRELKSRHEMEHSRLIIDDVASRTTT